LKRHFWPQARNPESDGIHPLDEPEIEKDRSRSAAFVPRESD
jgi:hypothetical protein